MRLDDILSACGPHKRKRRLGRGPGSTRGKTAGRGTKGMGSRSGAGVRSGYEGGQNPILARIPKRGFSNFNFAEEVLTVNVRQLNEKFADGDVVDVKALAAKGLIDHANSLVKVLGDGTIERKLTVQVNKVSKSAAEKIAAAGGKVELVA